MLEELSVRHLGVIAELSLRFGPGMTVVTGETGAGKTLVVEAIELLVGGRAESLLVRAGADEARIDGRFTGPDGAEVVVSRVVPRNGRSRAYLDGRPASVAELAQLGGVLVDLHGQHAHQALLQPAAQRESLDRYARIDHGPRRAALAEVRQLDGELADLGGDESARARQVDFLRFQLAELEGAQLSDPGEDDRLGAEEELLADAQAHQEAAAEAYAALNGDGEGGGAVDALASAIGALGDRAPFRALVERARGLSAELVDLASETRDRAESIEPDPERLAEVQDRRQLLRDLHRKYGDLVPEEATTSGRVAALMAVEASLSAQLALLESHGERADGLGVARRQALERLRHEEELVGKARREAAPRLARATEEILARLAMPRVRLDIEVDGDDVAFLLAANPGAPLLPLSRVASGGELARTMLALRLALDTGAAGSTEVSAAELERGGAPEQGRGPTTMIFDEVDAGIGGTAATAVGAALSALAGDRQVLVVTHLAQVAAWGDAQVSVTKQQDADATVSLVRRLEGEERVVELARMLSGSPESDTARRHAAELLERAAEGRIGAAINGSAPDLGSVEGAEGDGLTIGGIGYLGGLPGVGTDVRPWLWEG